MTLPSPHLARGSQVGHSSPGQWNSITDKNDWGVFASRWKFMWFGDKITPQETKQTTHNRIALKFYSFASSLWLIWPGRRILSQIIFKDIPYLLRTKANINTLNVRTSLLFYYDMMYMNGQVTNDTYVDFFYLFRHWFSEAFEIFTLKL